MKFVPLQHAMAMPVVGGVTLELPGQSTGLDIHRQPAPSRIGARDCTPKGGKKLRKDSGVRAGALVLGVGGSELALRRKLIVPLLEKYGAQGDVTLIPLVLRDDLGPLDADFVLLDPKQRLPMDRDASKAEYENPNNPHGSRCIRVQELVWGPGREPRAALFRLAEHPDVLVAREDLALELASVTRQGIAPVPAPYRRETKGADLDFLNGYQFHLGMHGFYPYTSVAPMPETAAADVAAHAAAAWFRLYGGQGQPGDRDAVLACPHYSHYLASVLDRDANDDTAATALRHPHYAFLYACQVDRCPRDDTRLAAAQHPTAALAYARYVDAGPHPVTQQGSQHPSLEGSYAKDMQLAAEIVAWRAAGEPLPEPVVAGNQPTARPAPSIPVVAAPAQLPARFAEDGQVHGPRPSHGPIAADVRSDMDEFIGRGLALVGLQASATPEAVVAALHVLIDQVQLGQFKLPKKKPAVMAAGCVFGEQLHRALGYQWAQVVDGVAGGGIALVDPQRAVAVYVFSLVERLLDAKAKSNVLALTYNMLAAGSLPPGARPGAYAALS